MHVECLKRVAVSEVLRLVVQVADSDSVAAKEALLQQVLDVSCVESSRRNTPAVNREWLNIKCSLPQHQLARADALHALSTGDNAARGRALLDAKLDSDTACFAQTLAGPQHLSWKNSAVFGTWLAECPVDNHGSIDLIHVRLFTFLCCSLDLTSAVQRHSSVN